MDSVFRVDEYQFERGAWSTWLHLRCRCGAEVATYQKDGPGPLLRCYFNRFAQPADLAALKDNFLHKDEANTPECLKCSSCAALLGRRMRYRDGRLAYELEQDAVEFD